MPPSPSCRISSYLPSTSVPGSKTVRVYRREFSVLVLLNRVLEAACAHSARTVREDRPRGEARRFRAPPSSIEWCADCIANANAQTLHPAVRARTAVGMLERIDDAER